MKKKNSRDLNSVNNDNYISFLTNNWFSKHDSKVIIGLMNDLCMKYCGEFIRCTGNGENLFKT